MQCGAVFEQRSFKYSTLTLHWQCRGESWCPSIQGGVQYLRSTRLACFSSWWLAIEHITYLDTRHWLRHCASINANFHCDFHDMRGCLSAVSGKTPFFDTPEVLGMGIQNFCILVPGDLGVSVPGSRGSQGVYTPLYTGHILLNLEKKNLFLALNLKSS